MRGQDATSGVLMVASMHVRSHTQVRSERGDQVTAPDLIPAETSTENLHWDWYSKLGDFTKT